MTKKLYRNETRKAIGGVAAGLADYFEVDVTLIRVIFILMAIFGLSGVLIYIILWLIVPSEPFGSISDDSSADHSARVKPVSKKEKKNSSASQWIGVILIFLGIYFLFAEMDIIPYWFSIVKLWPLLLIIPGFLILFGSRKTQHTTTEHEPDSSQEQQSEEESNKQA